MQRLIHELETAVAGEDSESDCITRVASRLGDYVKNQPELEACYMRPGTDTYARRLLHRDPHDRFVVVAMAWGPGHETPVHDHGTWGVIGMVHNKIAAWVYTRHDDGSREGYAELEETGYIEAEAGTVLPIVFPPDDEIHKIQNKWDQVAVGIHIYGKDITRCRRFDLRTNSWEWRELRYTDD